jgi:hypothetical protein
MARRFFFPNNSLVSSPFPIFHCLCSVIIIYSLLIQNFPLIFTKQKCFCIVFNIFFCKPNFSANKTHLLLYLLSPHQNKGLYFTKKSGKKLNHYFSLSLSVRLFKALSLASKLHAIRDFVGCHNIIIFRPNFHINDFYRNQESFFFK